MNCASQTADQRAGSTFRWLLIFSITIGMIFGQGTATPAPALAQSNPPARNAYATVASAMQLQERGDLGSAVAEYTAAVQELNAIIAAPLDPVTAKSARDRIAYSVAQLAVLQRGHVDVAKYLLYSYNVERKYLGFEIVRADQLFSQRHFKDAFAIWRTFSVRAGDDVAAGRPRELFDALDAAASSDYRKAERVLRAIGATPSRYGQSEPLYLLAEVERAQHREQEARDLLWRALSDRSEMLTFGLWGPQICAAGALASESRPL